MSDQLLDDIKTIRLITEGHIERLRSKLDELYKENLELKQIIEDLTKQKEAIQEKAETSK